ncbi:MAG TPA: hypothetical protein VMJ32_15085 [Pirellulales bacterium]|nr:hypothetical protein [Pirellulales bacterium]
MSAIVEPELSTERIWQCREQLQRRLAGIRRAMRAHLLWEGLAWTVAVCVSFAAVSLLIDRTFRPELASRLVLLTLGIIGIVTVAWKLLVQPLRLRLNDLDLAELLDRRRPGVGQRITNVLQLPELLASGKIDGSPAMIELAVIEDATALAKLNLRSTLNISRRRKVMALLLGTLALVAIFCFAFPSVASLWSRRWLAGSTIRWPQHTYLKVLGLDERGRLLVPRGEATVLEVDAQPEFVSADGGWSVPGRGGSLRIPGETKPHSDVPDAVAIEYRTAGGNRKQGTFTQYEPGHFRYELPPLADIATFTLTGGDDWLGPVEIVPLERPTVKDITLTAHIPGRSQPEVHHTGQQDSQLLFLPTTQLELALESDQPLASARIVTQGDDAPQLTPIDASHYTTAMTMKASVSLEFQLVAAEGGLSSKPYFLSIGLLTDRPPRVTVRVTGVGRRVTPTARIPLTIRSLDDFGIAQMTADLELTQFVDSKPQASTHQPYTETFPPDHEKLPTDVEKQIFVKLADVNAVAGNIVRLRGTATDACVLGPQQGTSRWIPLQVVTPEELFYEILVRQREQRGRFSKALDMAKGQLESIQKLATADEGSGVSRVHQVVARQIWQVANQLDATLQELTYNDLGSQPARDLLDTSIITPLRKLHDENFVGIGEKLQTLLEHRELREADRQAALDAQQAAVTEMQRILAQMSQWESFVDVINQLRQIIKSQNEVLDSTEKTEKDRIKGLFD